MAEAEVVGVEYQPNRGSSQAVGRRGHYWGPGELVRTQVQVLGLPIEGLEVLRHQQLDIVEDAHPGEQAQHVDWACQ